MKLIKLLRIFASASEADRQLIKMYIMMILVSLGSISLTLYELFVVQDEYRAVWPLLYGLVAIFFIFLVMFPDAYLRAPSQEPAQTKR